MHYFLKVQRKIIPFKCIKQQILQSGIYVLLSSGLFHIHIEYVMLENNFLGGFESQNQTDRAIKL